MYGIYLPADMFPALNGQRYTVCLYDTEEEATADLPRVQRKHGIKAYVDGDHRDDGG